MEPKREFTSVDIAAVERELSAYAGMRVDKAYLYDDGLVRLRCRDPDRGRVELIAQVGEWKRVHLATPERVPDAPDRPPQFAMMLRNRLGGARLESVSQYGFDRILEFEFSRDSESMRLIVELFGDGNVVVTDGTYRVVDSLETVRLKSRTVVPGSRYEFPEERINPLDIDRERFDRVMAESDTDVVRTLATQFNLGGLYAEELCTRAGVEKTLSIDQADATTYERLYDALDRLMETIQRAAFDPRLYTADGSLVDVTPVPLEEHREHGATSFESFMPALDEYFHRLAEEAAASARTAERDDLAEQLERTDRIIDQQAEAIDNFETEAAQTREKAERLYAHYELVDEILSTVQQARADGVAWAAIEDRFAEGREQGIPAASAVTDVDGANGTVTVSLEDEPVELVAAESLEHNADRLYTAAKEIEDKREGARAALEETREQKAALEARLAGEAEEPDEVDATDDRDWLALSSVPIRRSEPWYDRFRWFHTSDEFLVIGGRNADQNEELVRKYREPGDLVFHTQAHGGPVTILKATDPSESAEPDISFPSSSLEQAAQFAVSYSSVWKDGRFAGDVYCVDADQVSKTPESGEYLEKGGFAVRGDRRYFRDTAVGVAVGIQCEPVTRVIGGPPAAIDPVAESAISVEPGRFAQADVAKRLYRTFRERFTDESFVRRIASPDEIARFLPPGGSRILEG